MNKEVEILKIGSILPSIKEGDKSTIMVVLNGGTIFDHYVSILKEKCGDEYKYLRTDKSIVGTPDNRLDRFDKPSDTIKGIQNDEPQIGTSFGLGHWHTSTVHKIIDEDILITRNSVYAIHNPAKIRDKKLNDLGIN